MNDIKKFTNGVWESQRCHEGIEIFSGDLSIARIPLDSFDEKRKSVAKENAKLIKSAPILFEALEQISEGFEPTNFDGAMVFVEVARNIAKEAIIKSL